MADVRRVLLGLWLEIRVIPVLLWSFTAITLGTALAWHDGDGISVPGYLTAVGIGVLLQGLVAHCVNEVFDWRSGTDRDPAPRVISGGSKVIASGLLSPRALAWIGGGAALIAAVAGLLAAAEWGWVLALYGLVGLAGAVLYTLPPVRAAYRPFSGEAVAFVCVWCCTTGAYVLQRGELSGGAALAGIAYAASCVAMLMMHHYLDRLPDSRALPPKTTTIVRLGRAGRRYAVAVGVHRPGRRGPAHGAGGRAVRDRRGVLRACAGAPRERGSRRSRRPSPARSWGSSCSASPRVSERPPRSPLPLSFALLAAAILVPAEIAISGAAHRELMAARAGPAPMGGAEP